jgi:hypothetical protein
MPPVVHPRRAVVDNREESATMTDGIDWANLSREDKEVFFGWLDEFFSRHLDITISARSASPPVKPATKPSPTAAPPPTASRGPPV